MAMKRKAAAKKKVSGRKTATAKRAGARGGGGNGNRKRPPSPPPGRTFYVVKGSNVSKQEIEDLLNQGVPLRMVDLSKIPPQTKVLSKGQLKKSLSKKTMAAGVIYTLNAPFKVRQAA